MFRKFLGRRIRQIMLNQAQKESEKGIADINETESQPELPSDLSIEQKVEYLLQNMTLEEKINLMGGEDRMGISAIPRLKLRKLWCSDATSGVHNFGRATAFPAPIVMAATWNRDLLYQIGDVIGEECRAKGVSILLAPGINIYRVPTNGRNFEYMGEDPYLASELVVPYIQGVQKHDVATTVKHFACNNSDYDRHRMDSIVDERTLHEIYFPAFKAAVQEGKSKGVMCAYNLVNGKHCSENKYLLTDILRDRWNFSGFVISDWDCLYSTEGPLLAGLDLEMPKSKYYSNKKITELLDNGMISEKIINFHVQNLLQNFLEMNFYSRPNKDSNALEFGGSHDDIAYQTAAEGVVLLKNEPAILPFSNNSNDALRFAILGPNAKETTTMGGGSCFMYAPNATSIYSAIKSEFSASYDIEYIDVKESNLRPEDEILLTSVDYVIFCGGYKEHQETEARDKEWHLPNKQDELIQKLINLNPNLILIINSGGGFHTESWLSEIPVLIQSFFLGQNSGQVIADLLIGKINPSGKLPFTMIKNWEDLEANHHYVDHPGKVRIKRMKQFTKPRNRFVSHPCEYKEGLLVGYRDMDTNHKEPQFPFGFGLSYTSFAYSNLIVDKETLSKEDQLKISVDIENKGSLAGKEIVQVYVKDVASSIFRPEKELKAFSKISLAPQEKKTIEFTLDWTAFAYYDIDQKSWQVESGKFKILVGASSRDIKFSALIEYQ